ncbi:MAG: GNAT family N-acetyltransferase [Sphingobium sp.]
MIAIQPANLARRDELDAIFGARGEAYKCQCQRYKLAPGESFGAVPVAERAERLSRQTRCGQTHARETSGLVAWLDGEPAGWCAVEPRPAYAALLRVYRVPWIDRDEDRSDAGIWAITCFHIRAGYRRRGISRALVRAAIDFARDRGAHAIEGYPMITEPGRDIPWGELHVGSHSIFAAAGFIQVSRPTPRRAVMRIDLRGA